MKQRKYVIFLFSILFLATCVYILVRNVDKARTMSIGSSKDSKAAVFNDSSKLLLTGEMVYKKECQNCHGSFAHYDGPWLMFVGLDSRWPDKKELAAYIENPEAIRKKNAYARDLPKNWGTTMPGFPKLSDDDVTAVLAYILKKVKE